MEKKKTANAEFESVLRKLKLLYMGILCGVKIRLR